MPLTINLSGYILLIPQVTVTDRLKNYYELTKPKIWYLLVFTAFGSAITASYSTDTFLSPLQWVFLLVGIVTGSAAADALTGYNDRDIDAIMDRTKARPIPSGRLTPTNAFWFGVALEVLGSLELWLGVNALTSLLGIATIALYLFAYTPLKQKTWWSTTIGAFPGAIPPLIGFAGAANTLTPEAWALFGILFFWQFPHFYAIAWMYREDYARAGIQMLPVVEPDGESTARQILVYSLLLIPISLMPKWLGMTGSLYMVGALVMGLAFLYAGVRVTFDRTRVRARRVLLASVLYLPVLYGLMVLDPARL